MAIKKSLTTYIYTFVAGLSLVFLLGVAAPALAQNLTTNVQANISVSQSARTTRVVARSDTAITARITALNNLSTRLAAMKNVDAATKAIITANIQTALSDMTSLKVKIDADTDLTTLITDAKSITGNYRIYALIIPQGYIAASSDRIITINNLMSSLGTKLQTRITAAQSAGNDVTTLQSALADMNSKITDAKTEGQNAEAGVSGLVPDNGNATQLASNSASIKTARADIKTATQDLQTARQDIKTIMAGLQKFGTPTTTTSTTTNATTGTTTTQ